MKLALSTWPEVEAYLRDCDGIILPTGSVEQHGPVGLIGTDALCAETVADRAGEIAGAMVAPVVAYAPAPFNMGFPGTVSISAETFRAVVGEVVGALAQHGFRRIYVLNGHGANLEPLADVAASFPGLAIRVRSWWSFEPVNALRARLYGPWEGMHATPSEVAITQAAYRIVEDPGLGPPEALSADYVKAHAGDRHGPPDEHRARFPDGRVGSHSGLARPAHGAQLIALAAEAAAADFRAFTGG